MTSPVLAALVNARAAEQAADDRTLTSGVYKHLGMAPPQGDRSYWPVWQAWCDQRKISSFPALPASVAVFVLNHTDRLEKIVGSISAVHEAEGRANPVLSPIVIAALGHVLPLIKPPRSWDATHKIRFQQLPRDVATYVAKREADRDEEIRRLHREYAALRKDLINANPKQESGATAGTTDRNETAAVAAA